MSDRQVPVRAIAEAVLERMIRLGMTWRLRLARVVTIAADGTIRALHDGDSEPIRVVSMVGPVQPGARVFVLRSPPSGHHIVGWAARPSTLPTWACKSSEPQNATATFVADPELVLQIPAAGRYALTGAVWYESSVAAGFKAQFVFTSGSGSLQWAADGPTSSETSLPHMGLTFNGGQLTLGATGSFDRSWVQGTVMADGPATLTFQWAQATGMSAAITRVLTYSWLRLEAMR